MFCEHCGTEKNEESSSCVQCGQSYTQKVPLPEKRKKWPWIITLLVSLGLFSYLFLGSSLTPVDAITEHLQTVREGKLTEAYYEFSSKDFQKTVPLDVFKKYIKANPVLEHNKKFVIEDEGTKGDSSTVRGYIVAEDGSSLEAVYKLVMEDNEWKIFSISPVVRSEPEKSVQTSVTRQMIDPVLSFLSALQKPEFPEIFQSKLSKHFIQNTSYDQFVKFAEKNKILNHFTDYEIIEHGLNKGRGELVVVLNPHSDEIPFAFTVVKEDGAWKIFRMALGTAKEEAGLKSTELFEKELIPFVKTSAELIKTGKIQELYQQKTASEFRSEVDFSLFNDFIKEYPVLSQYTQVTVKDKGEIGDLAWVDLQFTQGQNSEVVEFTLGKDEGEWKIWGIRMNEKDSSSSYRT